MGVFGCEGQLRSEPMMQGHGAKSMHICRESPCLWPRGITRHLDLVSFADRHGVRKPPWLGSSFMCDLTPLVRASLGVQLSLKLQLWAHGGVALTVGWAATLPGGAGL